MPGTVGRPSKNFAFPDLMATILRLVVNNASADAKRRSERLNAVTTLDDLTNALKEQGFQISRSAVYLRLLPKHSLSVHGQKHVTTVPVRLVRPENSLRKEHSDGHFATATINYLNELAVFLGPDLAVFLSQDDKARVPLSLPAAQKQSHVLTHLQYRIQLPDHDWVVAAQHKLIPSVYAVCLIDENSVTYSGPTYVAVRSGKHDHSTSESHCADFVPFDGSFPKPSLELPSVEWRMKHVRQSQYCLQIVKCMDEKCCGKFRTDYVKLFPDRFIPPPVAFVRTSSGYQAADPDSTVGKFGSFSKRLLLKPCEPSCEFPTLPFDYYCHTVQPKLNERVCKSCGYYFPTKGLAGKHQKKCTGPQQIQSMTVPCSSEADEDGENLDEEEREADEENIFSVIRDTVVAAQPMPTREYDADGNIFNKFCACYEEV